MDVLILHGWNLSGSVYSELASLLKKRKHRVFTPDFPGFGSAKMPEKPYTLSDYVLFLKSYIQENGIKNPLIVGHSFGGRVAILYLSESLKKASTLALTGVPGYPPDSSVKVNTFTFLSKAGNSVLSLPGLKRLKPSAQSVLYKTARANDYAKTSGVMRKTFKNIISFDLEPSMRKLRVKTILVWGENDSITPVWIGEKMHAVISDSKLVKIEGEGHSVVYEKPGKFLDSLPGVV